MGFISTGYKVNLKRRRRNPPLPCYANSQASLARPALEVAPLPQPIQRQRAPSPPLEIKLTDLPAEILVHIFCIAGIGKDNMLPLTCRFFNDLLSPSRNRYLLNLAIETNFIANLNEGIDSAFWERKLRSSFSSLPDSYKDAPIIDRIYTVPVSVAHSGLAIDMRLFQFPFVNAEIVQSLHSHYGGILSDSTTICDQQIHREKYLEWRSLVLDQFVFMANESDRNMIPVSAESAEELLAHAESSVSDFRHKHNLMTFTPQTRSLSQTFHGNEHMSPSNLRKVLCIHHLYETEISGASDLLHAAFRCDSVTDAETYHQLTSLLDLNFLSSKDILIFLQAYEMCQQKLQSISEEQRPQHPLQSIVEQLYDLIRRALSTQYRLDKPEDTEHIWQSIKDIRIPELLDHVIKLGGPISLDLI